MAQNSGGTDYVRMAYALALSLKATQKSHSNLSIGVTPGYEMPERYAWAFDQVLEIPWGDHAANSKWKLENEWKVIHMTPYDETIKLDADMLFFSDIHGWWGNLALEDFVACNRVIDYRAKTIYDDRYRKTLSVNNLPSIYTAMMYFKKNDATFEIFDMARYVYYNWEAFFAELLIPEHRPEYVSTDVIFSMVLKILDMDTASYMERSIPTFTHMKSGLQGWGGWLSDDWRRHIPSFINSELEMRIGNYIQHFPLHYHVKEFLTDEIIDHYERYLGYK